jgi:hypothetical protein
MGSSRRHSHAIAEYGGSTRAPGLNVMVENVIYLDDPGGEQQ